MEKINLPIYDLYISIQGEGMYTGMPSIFISLCGCNLKCVFNNSICDTPCSSFFPTRSNYTVDDIKKMIEDNKHINHIVITGGEPLLYKKELEALLSDIYEKRLLITIETNGTLPMLNPLTTQYKVHLYSVNPKLSTSIPKPGQSINIEDGNYIFGTDEVKRFQNLRINIKNLLDFVFYSENYQFKWLYDYEEGYKEIEEVYKRMEERAEEQGVYQHSYFLKHHPNYYTQLLIEGNTEEDLKKTQLSVAEQCMKKGWRLSDRLHVRILNGKKF